MNPHLTLFAAAIFGGGACKAMLDIGEPLLVEPDSDGGAACRATLDRCEGDTLRSCRVVGQPPVDEVCAWGCSEVGAPHCARLLPSGGRLATPDLELDPAVAPATIVGPVELDADDGSIASHRSAGLGVIAGIGFQVRNGISQFAFASLVVDGEISIRGTRPVAFIVGGDATLNGVLDVRGRCRHGEPGPGGGAGGEAGLNGMGEGGGRAGGGSQATSAGSGGGHGAAGGRGGKSGSLPNPSGGERVGDPEIRLLAGGGGGGGGGGVGGGVGGGGGGALQIIAGGTLAFGTQAIGGVNAGGCGGERGDVVSSGGGGGAGGTILVEAPRIRLGAFARVAAAGGGGGAGRFGEPGQAGRIDDRAAPGGAGYQGAGGGGGSGGTAGAPAGCAGADAWQYGGGGGGGVGRLRFNTRGGDVIVEDGAMLVPRLDDPDPSATVGIAATQ